MTHIADCLDLGPAVREALRNRMPVVALESTIITHGMPYPENLETARQAEQRVRDAGATPATIAVLDGRIKAGLRGRELERLARETEDARKCSLRDLSLVVAAGRSGGTTVAATLHLANRIGIPVFATGGIGGVHRGASDTLDISADLLELGRASVLVVCAGPKAILDLGLTLEVLETHGVPVLGYGVDELPAFWSRHSGFPVDARVDTPEEAARILDARRDLDMNGGVLLCNPVPEAHALPRERVEAWIEGALGAARDQGVVGKALTPFLLRQVTEASRGRSLEANRALMESNARLAAEVAVALDRESPAGSWC